MTRNIALGNPAIHPNEDEFNRWPFSRALADRIAGLGNAEGSAVIGLYGRWGYGKSSVLNFIKHQLGEPQHRDRIIIFEFNPWLFTDRDALLTGFFTELAKKMDVALEGTGKKVGKFLADYGGTLAAVPFVGSGLKALTEQIGKRLSADPLENQRRRIAEIMTGAPRLIVVLVDDLDRLDRDEIMMMLKLVRLTADLPNIVYVLAFDDEMVGRAASTYYGTESDAGRQFLEKIVQFPFAIPAVGQQRLVDYVIRHARAATDRASITVDGETWATFRKLVDQQLSRRLSTPRQAIRYGSALDFALPILRGEVDTCEQMVVEGLRVLFPELYAYVRDHEADFTRPSDDTIAPSDQVLSTHARNALGKTALDEEVDAAAVLLRFLFYSNRQTEQPISDPRYFARHFGYALTTREISDGEVQTLIAVAGSPDDAFPAFVRRLATRNSPQLLGLLKRRLRNLSPPQCVALAKALPVFGELFTQGEHVKDDPGAKEFADFLAWLIHQAYPASRYEPANAAQRHILAAETTEKIEPLALASTFINALYDVTRSIEWKYYGNNYRREEEDDWLRVIAPEGWPVVLAPIARRLRECAERDPTAMVPKDNTGDTDLLDLWRRADPEGRREWLEAHLRQCPADGVNVLRYLGFSSYPVDEKYRDVAREIAPAAIKEALLRHFGSSLTADEANSSDLSLARYYLDEFENQTKTVSSGAESIE